MASSDIGAIADAEAPAAFVDALGDAVSAAKYWQEPDDYDRRLAHPDVSGALRPVAEAISVATAARWWATPTDRTAQHEVTFEDRNGGSTLPASVDPHTELIDWRANELAGERDAASLPADPTAPYSGRWWSTPAPSGLRRSTPALDAHGPVGLSLVEDGLGWTAAHSRALRTRSGGSIFEIDGPQAWVELVEHYPLTVTLSRRHDWWRATGQHVAWAIPDYLALAADYDGIHLSVIGYLSTAGRALPAGDAYTVLAGWDPDQTWWLTDTTQPSSPPTRWARDNGGASTLWLPAAT